MTVNQECPGRRRELMQLVGERSMVVVTSAPVRYRNGDVPYVYRQDSDFYYLTGFSEPESVLVLLPGRQEGESILFCRDQDEMRDRWEGETIGLESAVNEYSMDDAFPYDDMDDILPGLMEGRDKVYYSLGRDRDFDQRILEWIRRLRLQASRSRMPVPEEFVSLEHILHEMRLVKSPQEIKLLRKAVELTCDAHMAVWQQIGPGASEGKIKAYFQFLAASEGLELAYPSIVAAGPNLCTLHYMGNDYRFTEKDLVLMDMGMEYQHYAADITRTVPVAKSFSKEQKALYEVVFDAQVAAIEAIKPGADWEYVHQCAVKEIARGLKALGLVSGSLKTIIEKEKYKPYFATRTGHWLGMDVHDVGDYRVDSQWRVLEEGMVMAIEPAIIIPPDSRGVDDGWLGMAIRIEDNILVTRDGCEVLSASLPREASEIEKVMNA